MLTFGNMIGATRSKKLLSMYDSQTSKDQTAPMLSTDQIPGHDFETLDEKSVMERVCGNREFLQLVLTVFEEDCASHMASIRQAYDEQNVGEIASAAHKIKGVLGNMGGKRAWAYAKEMESRARVGNLADMDVIIGALTTSVEELVTALHDLVKSPQ
jgi:HPt (histidine-containing phosphotransfer) domain-containing protein